MEDLFDERVVPETCQWVDKAENAGEGCIWCKCDLGLDPRLTATIIDSRQLVQPHRMITGKHISLTVKVLSSALFCSFSLVGQGHRTNASTGT